MRRDDESFTELSHTPERGDRQWCQVFDRESVLYPAWRTGDGKGEGERETRKTRRAAVM